MTKLSGKIKVLIVILLVIIIGLSMLFANVYVEKRHLQKTVAEHNVYHWTEIHLMATQMENRGFTKEGITEFYPYINSKIYSSTVNLCPEFDGDSTKYIGFLNTYYMQLAMDIAVSENMSGEKLDEAIEIFKNATIDLKKLSEKIIKIADEEKGEIQLIDRDSDTYIKTEKKVKEFCNKYGEIISNFNNSNPYDNLPKESDKDKNTASQTVSSNKSDNTSSISSDENVSEEKATDSARNMEFKVNVTSQGSDIEGISINYKSMDLKAEKPYIEIEIKNDRETEYVYGESFSLEYQNNGKFENCAKEEVYFKALGHVLPSAKSNIEKYYLSDFDLSKQGTYKFSMKNSAEQSMWIIFNLSE